MQNKVVANWIGFQYIQQYLGRGTCQKLVVLDLHLTSDILLQGIHKLLYLPHTVVWVLCTEGPNHKVRLTQLWDLPKINISAVNTVTSTNRNQSTDSCTGSHQSCKQWDYQKSMYWKLHWYLQKIIIKAVNTVRNQWTESCYALITKYPFKKIYKMLDLHWVFWFETSTTFLENWRRSYLYNRVNLLQQKKTTYAHLWYMSNWSAKQ